MYTEYIYIYIYIIWGRWGPSRKTLHGGWGRSKFRNRVTRVGGTWGALGATRKIKLPSLISSSGRSKDPKKITQYASGLYSLSFLGFQKKYFSWSKTEIRNYFLRVLVAQNSSKIAPNHLGGDQKKWHRCKRTLNSFELLKKEWTIKVA